MKYPYYGKYKYGFIIVYFTEPAIGLVIIDEFDEYNDYNFTKSIWMESKFMPIKNKKEIKHLERIRFLLQT